MVPIGTTADFSYSALLRRVLWWIASRSLVYLSVVLAAGAAFVVASAIVAYVWTPVPSPQLAPPPAQKPLEIQPIPEAPLVVEVPKESITTTTLIGRAVYTRDQKHVGYVTDVIFSHKGRIGSLVIRNTMGWSLLGAVGGGTRETLPIEAFSFVSDFTAHTKSKSQHKSAAPAPSSEPTIGSK